MQIKAVDMDVSDLPTKKASFFVCVCVTFLTSENRGTYTKFCPRFWMQNAGRFKYSWKSLANCRLDYYVPQLPRQSLLVNKIEPHRDVSVWRPQRKPGS